MEYTEEQKQMWEETNHIANALCAMCIDVRLIRNLLNIANDSPDNVKQAFIRLNNAMVRISACNKSLQRMITKEGE